MMKSNSEDILNYRKVSDQVIIGGQPTEEQLRAVAADGFHTVINLATIEPRYSLPDEAGLVHSLGMGYYHIPVAWEDPKESDFEAFDRLMAKLPNQNILIHCAANYRVTAFYSLYALKNLGWSETQADALISSVWDKTKYPIWDKFIHKMKDSIKGDRLTAGSI